MRRFIPSFSSVMICVSALFPLLSVLSPRAHAERVCNEPALAQCRQNYIDVIGANDTEIAKLQRLLANPEQQLQICHNDQVAISNRVNNYQRELDTGLGTYSERLERVRENTQTYQKLVARYEVMSQFQVELQAHFSEVILALQSDISASTSTFLADLLAGYQTELARSTDRSQTLVLNLTISSIKEIIANLATSGSTQQRLLDRLSRVMSRSDFKLDELTRVVIEGAISGQNPSELNLDDTFLELLATTQSDLESSKTSLADLNLRLRDLAERNAKLSTWIVTENGRLTSQNAHCRQLESDLRNTWPQAYSERAQNGRSLWAAYTGNTCEAAHCHYEREGNGFQR